MEQKYIIRLLLMALFMIILGAVSIYYKTIYIEHIGINSLLSVSDPNTIRDPTIVDSIALDVKTYTKKPKDTILFSGEKYKKDVPILQDTGTLSPDENIVSQDLKSIREARFLVKKDSSSGGGGGGGGGGKGKSGGGGAIARSGKSSAINIHSKGSGSSVGYDEGVPDMGLTKGTKVVKSIIILQYDYELIKKNMHAFIKKFQKDFATNLGIHQDRIQINTIIKLNDTNPNSTTANIIEPFNFDPVKDKIKIAYLIFPPKKGVVGAVTIENVQEILTKKIKTNTFIGSVVTNENIFFNESIIKNNVEDTVKETKDNNNQCAAGWGDAFDKSVHKDINIIDLNYGVSNKKIVYCNNAKPIYKANTCNIIDFTYITDNEQKPTIENKNNNMLLTCPNDKTFISDILERTHKELNISEPTGDTYYPPPFGTTTTFGTTT